MSGMASGSFAYQVSLFQHKNNPKVPDYDYDFHDPLLQRIGALCERYGHRLTFHPGQFNVLGTPRTKAWHQTLQDLEYHATVLDIMGMGKDLVMVTMEGGL